MAENKNETLKKARIEMNHLAGDAEIRRLAELREKWEMDRISAINYATKIGKEEGKKEGIEKGIEEGKKKEKLEIAIEMLKEKMPIDTIAKLTKLSKEEIEKIELN